jgi:DNA-binding MarR family transcriptional regulator
VRTSPVRIAREDWATLTTTAAAEDLVEMFFQLARVNAALRSEIDRSLLEKQGLTFQAFDAMTVISARPEGCGEVALAGALGLAPDDARTITDSLIASGYLSRTRRPNGSDRPAVMLTLQGGLVLSRAGRIVDGVLDRRIASALSRQELSQLECALAQLRPGPAAQESPSSAGAAGAEWHLAADV